MMRREVSCATWLLAGTMLWLSGANAVPAGKWTWADRPFDGTWVIQPELTTFDMRLPVLSLDHGVFRRADCRTDPIELPADGAPHQVKGQPFFETMSVRVLGPRRVEIVETSADNKQWKGSYTVSKDGRAMTLKYEDERAAKPVSGVLAYTREGEAVAGAHALSGTWRPRKLTQLSANGLAMTFTTQISTLGEDARIGPDPNWGFSLMESDGRSADGKIDAHDYPLNGYLQRAAVSLSHLQPNLLQINRTQNGQLVEISRALVSDDGQTMTLSQIDWMCQAKTIFTLSKQTSP